MQTFVTAVGWFVIAMLAFALACGMGALLLFCFHKAMERRDDAIAADTRSELGRQLGAAGWWFSEHPPTSLAIRILGDRLLNGLSTDPNGWRDQWQKGRDPREKLQVSESGDPK
jgi:hypothetical protein